ncbi:substrate-binding domain-containing protein [Actinomadura madurae]|uniref:substrate-binding domain-containing protein n=1 Tax=Actinomadura madurae TaxID=1993 RepID=UPI0020D212EC|nr:substrate-binding domain-containing protein [Actinomadura madurae]MCP9947862.1 substrate-binding domain-containing protein [Actinomadura madurae]
MERPRRTAPAHAPPGPRRPSTRSPGPPARPARRGPAHAAAKPPRGRWLPGRGRPPRRVGGILLGPLAGAVGLVLLTGLGAYAVAAAGDGCSGDDALTLTVAAAPDIAPAVIRAAGRLNDAKDEVDGRCVRARVRATEPAAVATLLSGKGVAGVTERPDVWIPDSSLWTKLVGSSDRPGAAGSFTDLGGMASSPIVLAMPRGLATQLRNLGAPEQPSWKELLAAAGASDGGQDPDAGDGVIPARLFRLQVPDPDRSATGMGSLMLAGALLAAPRAARRGSPAWSGRSARASRRRSRRSSPRSARATPTATPSRWLPSRRSSPTTRAVRPSRPSRCTRRRGRSSSTIPSPSCPGTGPRPARRACSGGRCRPGPPATMSSGSGSAPPAAPRPRRSPPGPA